MQHQEFFGRPASLDDTTVVCVITKEGTMTPLSKFKFKTIDRNKTVDPVVARRTKLACAIEEQKHVLAAHKAGTVYTVERHKWMHNEFGEKVMVQRQKPVRPWFFAQDGGYYLQVRYGARVISIDGQNNAVFVETLEELEPIYDTLIEVTKSGALDDVIERTLARKPKYKPGAAKTAELHKLSKT